MVLENWHDVVENNIVVGVLTWNDILAVLAWQGRSAPVVTIVCHDFQREKNEHSRKNSQSKRQQRLDDLEGRAGIRGVENLR